MATGARAGPCQLSEAFGALVARGPLDAPAAVTAACPRWRRAAQAEKNASTVRRTAFFARAAPRRRPRSAATAREGRRGGERERVVTWQSYA